GSATGSSRQRVTARLRQRMKPEPLALSITLARPFESRQAARRRSGMTGEGDDMAASIQRARPPACAVRRMRRVNSRFTGAEYDDRCTCGLDIDTHRHQDSPPHVTHESHVAPDV